MSLRQLQREFRRHILTGNGPLPSRVTEHAQRGVRVYRHAYRATLIDCLRDTYEKTAAWLGAEAFETAADAYIAGHTPTSWTLADYGQSFPEHLAAIYADDPEIAELAWLDRALRVAFAAADLPAIDPTRLAGVDWETASIRFALHVAARMTNTNVVAIWNALAADEMPPACVQGVPGGLLVWRDGLSPSFRTTAPVETAAAIATLAGRTFAQTCSETSAALQVDVQEIGGVLGGWLREGLIVAID